MVLIFVAFDGLSKNVLHLVGPVSSQLTFLYLFLQAFQFVYSFFTSLQLRPNFADAWSNLASAYMRKGRLSEAAQCCRQALALNPLLVCFTLVMVSLYDPIGSQLSRVRRK